MSYSKLAAFYDRLQIADYEEIGTYYRRFLPVSGILLDLACGTGILARYFAGRGYDVIAADISPEMLSEAMKTPCDNVQYLCQDMTRLDLYGTIDACICTLDGFNHLPGKDAVKAALARISLFMNTGGMLAFDVNTLYKHNRLLSGNTFVYDMDDVYCIWQNSACEDNRIDMTLDIFAQNRQNWSRYTENLSEVAYSLEEITQWLTDAGFGDVKVYDWLTLNPVHNESEKAVFVCQK
jgi:SAM-dependent methyltransferase